MSDNLQKLKPGTILFPAEGEGRNAVFAAKLGWKVSAFDISQEGRNKAMKLAQKNRVDIDYQIGDFSFIQYEKEQFDAIALIYAHFASNLKSSYHKKLQSYLRSGGTIIFEAFSKKHIEYNSKNEKAGGPKDIDMLFTPEEVAADFQNFEIIELLEKEVELNEGQFHVGKGYVVRFIGRKK